jgi:uncharacterized protein
MEERNYLILLYDYYSDLLNEKQKEYFEQYYFDNLSLAEISDNYGVSRNAIHKVVKSIEAKLYEYEEKLSLYKKNEQLKKIILTVKDEQLKKELEKLL